MADIPTVDLGPEDEAPPPSEDRLDRIVRLARLQVLQERAVEEAEEQLDRAKAALRRTREADLPEALAAAGMTGVPLSTGEVIEVVREVFAGIPKGKEEEAFAWFVEDGNGDLIKHTISIKLPRGLLGIVRRIKTSLSKFNATLADKEKFELRDKQEIHHQTLQKFVRDADKAGRDDLPEDLLGIFRRRVTVVTRPEEAKL